MRRIFLLWLAGSFLLTTGCTSTRAIKMKVGSEPNGAHVAFQLNSEKSSNADWIYLGNTPVEAVRTMNLGELQSASSVKLKVMRSGYHDRVKEWTGPGFWHEYKEKGGIFWAPRLVPGDRQ
ncbi:MAG: hypothetical protein DSZ33_03095 [Gammaproteobacteria bacterium]|nr:MAG: hypothetical protein DSZ33_03095 [Gammaproteobacteria bacterium]